ncbi:MAG: hypothetical protein WCK17_15590, partial [Verrucomicrobiota bacterium]
MFRLIAFSLLSLLDSLALPMQAQDIADAKTPSAPIPFSEIGAKATSEYNKRKGNAMSVRAMSRSARLHTAFQKLSAVVTREGLWLDSNSDKRGRLHLSANSIGRDSNSNPQSAPKNLPRTGTVSVAEQRVTFTRPELAEEYSVSVDGVRQDFIVTQRPAGEGSLFVNLALRGASAEATGDGAKLTLKGSHRALAYSRLRVTDASGKELAAKMLVPAANRITLRVEDAQATYPVRIDPTFSDADWVSLNSGIRGTNGVVYAAVVDGNGNLFIGGTFTTAGGVIASNIAKWNGSRWTSLGSGTSGVSDAITALAVDNVGNLYAGGRFQSAGGVTASNIAKWNGSTWSALGSGLVNSVSALAVDSSGVLYCG